MLLVTKNWIDDGRQLLEQLVRGGFDVATAGWIKFSEDGDWRLYIASKVVDEKGRIEAYRIIDEVLQKTWPDPWLSLFDIKVVRPTSRLGIDLAQARDRAVGGVVSRAQQARLGEKSVDEAYIYAPVGGGQTSSASTPRP